MKKVLVIIGPTAIGKSGFGINIAKSFNGEIISGDSIQVYKDFNIGSGKVTKEEMQDIPHYLIDILDNNKEYNVASFQNMARQYIDDINHRNKLPIIVGGTGLYIKSCLYDYEFSDEKDEDNEYNNLSNEEIYQKLKEVDPKSLEKIHINNRKRLVRALNIYEKNNITKSEIEAKQEHKMIYDALIIGLTADRDVVYSRIEKRVDNMFDEGLVKEVSDLIASGLSFKSRAMQGIGYREFEGLYNKEIDIEEVKNLIKRDSRRYAKRQYTFFNNQLNVEWFDINDLQKAKERIKTWYES